LAEYVGKIDIQRRALDLKTRRFDPFRSRAHAAGAGLWIDDPDRFYTHCAIVLCTLLGVGVAIVGRQDFDDQQRRVSQDIRLGPCSEYNQIGHANSFPGYANPLFCAAGDSPFFLMVTKPMCQQPLYSRVLPLTHVALPDFSIQILAVRPIVGIEIFLERDVRNRSHCLKQ